MRLNAILNGRVARPLARGHATKQVLQRVLLSFGFSFLLQPQNMCSQHIEPALDEIAKQRIVVDGQGRCDLVPILGLKYVQGDRKEITIFHHDVAPLMLDEIPNDGIDILTKKFLIRENAVDRSSDAVQTLRALLVLTREIADLLGRSGIASFQPGKDQVLLGMMIQLRVNLEVANNRADDLVIRFVAAVEDLQLTFKDVEQPLDVAMLSTEELNNHCQGPTGWTSREGNTLTPNLLPPLS